VFVRNTDNQLVFLGCYTHGEGGDGTGIVVARREPGRAALRAPELVAVTPSPSYVARHPTADVLYAVNELAAGRLTAFRVGADGALAELGTWSTGGSLPCFVAVTPDGRHALVTNYGSGSVASFVLDHHGVPTHRGDLAQHAGRGKHPERQEGPHVHSVAITDEGILALDLGLDTVYRYRIDHATGRLGRGEPLLRTRPGTGPRHLAGAGADVLYLIGELDASVNTYARTHGRWHDVATVGTSVGVDPLPSEIAVSPDRKYLYVANRGPDTIAVFALADGKPSRVGEVSSGGRWPRHFTIVDGYLYVANQQSGLVTAFALDPATGLPVPTGDVLRTPSPSCVLVYNRN
jgi:6-phosphogluconolactonase